MKKLFIFFIIMFNIVSFSFFDKIKSEIKLKLEDPPRFESIKIIRNGKLITKEIKPGSYTINIYELNYSGNMFEKNKFFKIFSKFLNDKTKNGKSTIEKKYSLLINENLFNDLKRAKQENFFEEEEILGLPASSLNEYQKVQLIEFTKNLNLSEYIGTDQEYLNRQIYILYELLNIKNYEVNKVYSELDKEILVKQLKDQRKIVADLFEKSGIEYFIKKEFSETNLKKFKDDTLYKFDKDVVISENVEDQAILPEINNNVFINNFDIGLLDLIINDKIKLKRKLLLVDNTEYKGYTYNEENTIVIIGGDKEFFFYPNYKIVVEKRSIDVEELYDVNSEYYISDFFK